jgi:cytochrome c oxidase subunit 2
MITQFAFTPTVTTVEMREDAKRAEKVTKINKLRADRKAKGEDVDPWEFDYILLCNKICGSSHYNMQMKIIVETEEEFNTWMKAQQTFGQTMASK